MNKIVPGREGVCRYLACVVAIGPSRIIYRCTHAHVGEGN